MFQFIYKKCFSLICFDTSARHKEHFQWLEYNSFHIISQSNLLYKQPRKHMGIEISKFCFQTFYLYIISFYLFALLRFVFFQLNIDYVQFVLTYNSCMGCYNWLSNKQKEAYLQKIYDVKNIVITK